MQLEPLTPVFGQKVHGVDLSALDDAGFAELRTLFEDHSLLVFPDQTLDDAAHVQLARRFGPIEDRSSDDLTASDDFEVPKVSNLRDDGSVSGEMDLHTLNLKANMLWHTDSTFLPRPALTNILMAHVVTKEGGATEFASTRVGWASMPDSLKAQLRGKIFRHKYSHSRAQISPELAALPMFQKWPAQLRPSTWVNPVNGSEALYIASHVCAVEGLDPEQGTSLIQTALDWVTQPQFVYRHDWTPKDVLIWDQRAVLHRATPWNYKEPRHLTSICVTATSSDGVDAMGGIV